MRESQNPAGETIRSAQGRAMEPGPTTGQQPVGSGSPYRVQLRGENDNG